MIFRDNPATTATIGWDQVSGDNPVVYFGLEDFGTNHQSYPNQQEVSRAVTFKGMNNHFARLTNLQANSTYYFVIRDSEGTSQRFWFRTCPDNPDTRMSFIIGGDSRNNRAPRQNANRLVSKLKPHAVLFAGDMTSGDTDTEWANWMQDWQESIHEDGRIIPIVAARGNHERSNDVIYNIFDVPSPDVYYAINFGGSLVRAYTLNTEMSISGDQAEWLEEDLKNNALSTQWKLVQYHKPIRPHVSFKPEGNTQYNSWAPLFYDYGVNLVVECDAHLVKRTWPIRPSAAEGNDEGFARDDTNGTVYIGEGCWGAPLRENDDNKEWTRDSDSFNQFNWVFVDKQKIEVRTVKVDNEEQVGEVDDNDIFTAPVNLDLWEPANGTVLEISSRSNNISPEVNLEIGDNPRYLSEPQFVTVSASATDLDGTIDRVEFYVNGVLEFTAMEAPYTASLYVDNGVSSITARAYDEGGRSDESIITLSAGSFVYAFEKLITDGADDVEEQLQSENLYINSSDLEIVEDGDEKQLIGLRFTDVLIPANAQIISANIHFTSEATTTVDTYLSFFGEKAGNSEPFAQTNPWPGSRERTDANVLWKPKAWGQGTRRLEQLSPDISPIINEIIRTTEWTSGNALAIMIEGEGNRTAFSFEGDPSAAAMLKVKYVIGTINVPSIELTSIQDQQTLLIPENEVIELRADATDSDGSVSDVRYFVNGREVGSSSESPYSYDWEVPGYEIYEIMAAAEDNDGAESRQVLHVEIRNPESEVLTIPIENAKDDAVESSSGTMDITGDILPLAGLNENQVIGLRFSNVPLPDLAEVEKAFIEFTAAETNTDLSGLSILAEASGASSSFENDNANISSRDKLSTVISWKPLEWNYKDEARFSTRTSDLAPLVRQVVDRPDWSSGQSITFFVEGTGSRSVYSFDSGFPARLTIVYKADDVLSSNTLDGSLFSIYPTTAEDEIILRSNATGTGTYIIYDTIGRKLINGTIGKLEEKRISIKDLSNGLFFVKFSSTEGQEVLKFVVGQ